LNLDEIPRGTRVFLDASIFLHHFLGASRECRALLERCERSEVRGVTSALVLAQVADRLMALEGDPRDAEVAPSHLHEEAVARIPLMGVAVLPLDLRVVLAGGSLRRRHALSPPASLDVAVAREAGIDSLATAHPDREAVEGLRVYRASDLG
jgi:predicted nucleic acid-binding protein